MFTLESGGFRRAECLLGKHSKLNVYFRGFSFACYFILVLYKVITVQRYTKRFFGVPKKVFEIS